MAIFFRKKHKIAGVTGGRDPISPFVIHLSCTSLLNTSHEIRHFLNIPVTINFVFYHPTPPPPPRLQNPGWTPAGLSPNLLKKNLNWVDDVIILSGVDDVSANIW